MELQIVIGGLGGEGIVFMTTILAESIFHHGYPVLSTETHGMAMRGGSVISQLKVGDFQSPMIRYGHADFLIATSEAEVERNRLYLKRVGGRTIFNSAGGGPDTIDAKGVADQLGNPRGANLVLLGYAVAKLNGFEPHLFEETIITLSPPSFSEANRQTFRIGFERGRSTCWPDVSLAPWASSPIVRPVTVGWRSCKRPASIRRLATKVVPPAA